MMYVFAVYELPEETKALIDKGGYEPNLACSTTLQYTVINIKELKEQISETREKPINQKFLKQNLCDWMTDLKANLSQYLKVPQIMTD